MVLGHEMTGEVIEAILGHREVDSGMDCVGLYPFLLTMAEAEEFNP